MEPAPGTAPDPRSKSFKKSREAVIVVDRPIGLSTFVLVWAYMGVKRPRTGLFEKRNSQAPIKSTVPTLLLMIDKEGQETLPSKLFIRPSQVPRLRVACANRPCLE